MVDVTEMPAMEDQPERGEGRRSLLRDPIPWVMLVVVFALDQITKLIVIGNLERTESWPESGFFRFTHAWNTGTAFSLFQGQSNILIFVSLLAVVLLLWVYRSADRPSLFVRFAFGMQLGGAIGNLLDRLRLGHVTDFIDVGPWPIFNLADSAIVVGIGLMIFYFWVLQPREEAEAAAANRAARETVEPERIPNANGPDA